MKYPCVFKSWHPHKMRSESVHGQTPFSALTSFTTFHFHTAVPGLGLVFKGCILCLQQNKHYTRLRKKYWETWKPWQSVMVCIGLEIVNCTSLFEMRMICLRSDWSDKIWTQRYLKLVVLERYPVHVNNFFDTYITLLII